MPSPSRLTWHTVAAEGAKALYGVHHYITTSTNLPEELIHLVFLRVSQINGCAHCIDLHTRDLLKTMPIDRVALVPVWEEVPHLCSVADRSAPLRKGRDCGRKRAPHTGSRPERPERPMRARRDRLTNRPIAAAAE